MNLHRVKLLSEFNKVFKDAYFTLEIDRPCKVMTSKASPTFKHELSTLYLRSGFKITIENDKHLPLIQRAIIAHHHFGAEVKLTQGSTNARIPISKNIPAICIRSRS